MAQQPNTSYFLDEESSENVSKFGNKTINEKQKELEKLPIKTLYSKFP
jgi:hypothetical protein